MIAPLPQMSKQDPNYYLIHVWEQTARDDEDRAQKLEELVPYVSRDDADFMRREARIAREQALRFRKAARRKREG